MLTIPFNEALGKPTKVSDTSYQTSKYGSEKINIQTSSMTTIQGYNASESQIKDFILTVEGEQVYSAIEKKLIKISNDVTFEGKQGFEDYVAQKLTNALEKFDDMKDLLQEKASNLGVDFISELSNAGIKIGRRTNLDCSLLNSHYTPDENEFRDYVESLPENKGILTVTNSRTNEIYAIVITQDQSRYKTPGISEIIKADRNGAIQQKTSYESDVNIGRLDKTEIRMADGTLSKVRKSRTLKDEARSMKYREQQASEYGISTTPETPKHLVGKGKITGELIGSVDPRRIARATSANLKITGGPKI